ncbi:MAG TPA: glycosyltransferase, partial [Candidatus Ozemobacteraceae bacterium]|nr:glycosyltransferase [Candidatus Ozemobacteraceae bacterium]
ERVLATRTDRLITLSETLKIDLLKRLRSTKPNHIQVVPLGLPLEKLAASPRHTGRFRQSLGVDAKTCLWGIVARLVPVKNHALLLDTFARLARQHDTLHLAIVGGGELADSLRNRVRKLGLSHRVHFTGIFHPIEDVYADLDLLLLTSLNEGTPVVLMESLAAGCPAAATAVGGVADVFRDCGSGTLLPCDPEGLRRRLSVLVQSHSPAQSLSPEIRARVVERYSCTSLARRTAAVYAPLLAHRVPEYHQL